MGPPKINKTGKKTIIIKQNFKFVGENLKKFGRL